MINHPFFYMAATLSAASAARHDPMTQAGLGHGFGMLVPLVTLVDLHNAAACCCQLIQLPLRSHP